MAKGLLLVNKHKVPIIQHFSYTSQISFGSK